MRGISITLTTLTAWLVVGKKFEADLDKYKSLILSTSFNMYFDTRDIRYVKLCMMLFGVTFNQTIEYLQSDDNTEKNNIHDNIISITLNNPLISKVDLSTKDGGTIWLEGEIEDFEKEVKRRGLELEIVGE